MCHNGDYETSQITRLELDNFVHLKEVQIQSKNIANIIQNEFIKSEYFWNDTKYFENNFIDLSNNQDTNLLARNLSKVLEFENFAKFQETFEQIKVEKKLNQQFNLIFQLNSGYEWNQSLYSYQESEESDFYINEVNQLVVQKLNLNNSKIIDFDSSKFNEIVSKLSEEEFKSNFSYQNINKFIVDSNVGIDNLDAIQNINIQTNYITNSFSLVINLTNNYSSKELSNYLVVDNINFENNDEKKIDLSKINVMKFMNFTHTWGDINFKYLKKSMDNPNNIFVFNENYRPELLVNLLKMFDLSTNSFNEIKISLKNENKNLKYTNSNNRNWAIPLRMEIIKNKDFEFVNNLPTIAEIKFNDSYTEVKIGLLENNEGIYLETNLVCVSPSIEIKDTINFDEYNINLFTMSWISYAFDLLRLYNPNNDITGMILEYGNHVNECTEDIMTDEWDEECNIDIKNKKAAVLHWMTKDDGWLSLEKLYKLVLFDKNILFKKLTNRIDFYIYISANNNDYESKEERLNLLYCNYQFKFFVSDIFKIKGLNYVESSIGKIINSSDEKHNSISIDLNSKLNWGN